MTSVTALPTLVPKLDAILILDGDGDRLAGKYYSDFLGSSTASTSSREELRLQFEKQLHTKVAGMSARGDAAEVVHVQGRTVVFCGGTSSGGANAEADGAPSPSSNTGDVRVVHVGPPSISELVLARLCEGMYNALSQLMGGLADRSMVLDNLALVFLLIDKHCDGGIILEMDPSKLAVAVLLRDGDDVAVHADDAAARGVGGPNCGGGPALGGAAAMGSTGKRTFSQALHQLQQHFLPGLKSTTTRVGISSQQKIIHKPSPPPTSAAGPALYQSPLLPFKHKRKRKNEQPATAKPKSLPFAAEEARAFLHGASCAAAANFKKPTDAFFGVGHVYKTVTYNAEKRKGTLSKGLYAHNVACHHAHVAIAAVHQANTTAAAAAASAPNNNHPAVVSIANARSKIRYADQMEKTIVESRKRVTDYHWLNSFLCDMGAKNARPIPGFSPALMKEQINFIQQLGYKILDRPRTDKRAYRVVEEGNEENMLCELIPYTQINRVDQLQMVNAFAMTPRVKDQLERLDAHKACNDFYGAYGNCLDRNTNEIRPYKFKGGSPEEQEFCNGTIARLVENIEKQTNDRMDPDQLDALNYETEVTDQKKHLSINDNGFVAQFVVVRNNITKPHRDEDAMVGTISCIAANPDDQKQVEGIITLFLFPEFKLAVALRCGYVLRINPKELHCAANPRDSNAYLFSLYTKARLVAGYMFHHWMRFLNLQSDPVFPSEHPRENI